MLCAEHVWAFHPDGAHDAREVRLWRRLRDCSDPRCMRCQYCNTRRWVRCDSSAGGCRPCAGRYQRRVHLLAGEGARQCAGVFGDRIYMLTLTAPGGDCDLAEWNGFLPQRWSWFVTEVRRRLPRCKVEFLKTYEYQRRGALHVHALIRVLGPVSVRNTRSAFRAARDLWGFGRQWKLDEASPAAAWYVAKYVAKHAHEMRRGCGRRVWSCSRKWGSMKAIRERQRAWVEAAARPLDPGLDPKTDIYAGHPSGGVDRRVTVPIPAD